MGAVQVRLASDGFLSTPSARRATIAPFTIPVLQIYFYPRPPRGGRPDSPVICGIINYISIHALREEGDHFVHHLHHHPADFYPRPPRGGRPHMTSYVNAFHKFLSTPSARRATFAWARAAKKRERFLSTPSARRATSGRCPRLRQDRYFYPRPPRGGRRPEPLPTRRSGYFYPRPPRGGRHASRRHRQHRANFYPRPPRGGRQGGVDGLSNGRLISIHALREEGDHVAQPGQLANLLFLSTPSARRATLTGVMV